MPERDDRIEELLARLGIGACVEPAGWRSLRADGSVARGDVSSSWLEESGVRHPLVLVVQDRTHHEQSPTATASPEWRRSPSRWPGGSTWCTR